MCIGIYISTYLTENQKDTKKKKTKYCELIQIYLLTI